MIAGRICTGCTVYSSKTRKPQCRLWGRSGAETSLPHSVVLGSPWPPMPTLPSAQEARLPQKERAWAQHQVHPGRMETPRLASGCSCPTQPPEGEAGGSAPRQGGLRMLLQVHQSHREYCQHLQRSLVQTHMSGKEDFFPGQLPKMRGKQYGLYNPIRKGQKTIQKQETARVAMRNTRSSYFLFFFFFELHTYNKEMELDN